MVLSMRTRRVIENGLGDKGAGKELADKIDAPGALSSWTIQVLETALTSKKAATDLAAVIAVGSGITGPNYKYLWPFIANCFADLAATNEVWTELS